MKWLSKSILSLTLLTATVAAQAIPRIDAIRPPPAPINHEEQPFPVYMYAEKPRSTINWLYIGFAPRMQDPNRIKVVIAKKSFTMRASLMLTPQEVADYPMDLISRMNGIYGLIDKNNVEIPQLFRYVDFEEKVNAVMDEVSGVPQDLQSRYEYGLKKMQEFFPGNIFEIIENGQVVRVEAHFVYPVTIHKNVSWPRARTYHTQMVEERRSYYSKEKGSHIFGGFPVLWIDPTGAGTGIHGPIRYSRKVEKRKDGTKGKMPSYWAENNFLNEEINPTEGIDPNYRWDVVRTNQSHGCFRAEVMELRHLLPSSQASIKKVAIEVIDGYDYLTIPGHIENRVVNVNYYLVDPYQVPNKEAFLKKTFGKHQGEMHTFPYLDPKVIEFSVPSGGAATSLMGLFNQAH